ncbi:hypothetical protein VCHA34P129_30154 [Vibrio chagasii]|nr:hypothetical protein VCHA34P129_30154 [Vibrio chagasii]CAH7179760.1 hypothetical protein VCHA52P455_20226 [Vibrio chagasii]
MNKIRLIFLLFVTLFISLISFIILTNSEYERVTEYGEPIRELGHEVLEMRDHITNAALTGTSDPYQMSEDLVILEKELQQLREIYQGKNIHSAFFKDLPTAQLLERFYNASMSNLDTLDKLVGLSVARQFILQSLTQQLTKSSSTRTAVNNADIEIQSELLASVLVRGIRHQNSGINSELANLYKTFTELNQQQSQLLSQVLSAHSMEYIEHIEHRFTDLQDQLKGVIVKLIIVLAFLTLVFSFAIFILRVFELKRNNLSYQEAANEHKKRVRQNHCSSRQ